MSHVVDVCIDGVVDEETVEMNGFLLSVASHAAEGLCFAGLVLLLGVDVEGMDEDAVIGDCQVGAGG